MDADHEHDVEEWLKRREDVGAPSGEGWRERLKEAVPYLRMVLPINQIERVEQVFKQILRAAFAEGLDGEAARFLARAQREVGFVLKYKSYALKCASPLGYSIFLQRPREGFSFQRHITRKTEIFHVLEPLDGARVFLCSSEAWEAAYERGRFQSWLDGRADEAFDRHVIVPRSGDVFHVDRLGVVHTVLGCVLEEYATVSVDMVDRLHDQNEGRATTLDIRRADIEERLRRLVVPETNANYAPGNEAAGGVEIGAEVREGVRKISLSKGGGMEAARYLLEPGAVSALEADEARAASVFVLGGRGALALGDAGEVKGGVPVIEVAAGDLLLVPPGAYRAFQAGNGERLAISEHKIVPGLALE